MPAPNACPVCGGALVGGDVRWLAGARILSRGALSVHLSKNEASLFDYLWQHRDTGHLYTAQQLADHVYRDDPDGGPDEAAVIIRIVVFRLRFRIAGFGVTVSASRGTGAGYRIAYK